MYIFLTNCGNCCEKIRVKSRKIIEISYSKSEYALKVLKTAHFPIFYHFYVMFLCRDYKCKQRIVYIKRDILVHSECETVILAYSVHIIVCSFLPFRLCIQGSSSPFGAVYPVFFPCPGRYTTPRGNTTPPNRDGLPLRIPKK